MINITSTNVAGNASTGSSARSGRLDATAIRGRFRDPLRLAAMMGQPGARPHGRGCVAHCVLHDDATPSMSLYAGDDGTIRFRCFGCGRRGDVLSLVALVLKLSLKTQFRKVLRAAAAIAEAMEEAVPIAITLETKPLPPLDDFTRAAVLGRLLELCPLVAQSDVTEYLSQRQVLDGAIVDGWAALPAPASQHELLAKLVGEFGDATIRAAGFLTSSGGIPWPEHRVVVVWRSRSAVAVGLQRRLIRANREREPKYVTMRDQPLAQPYGVEKLDPTANWPVALVEGAIDVLSMRALSARHGLQRIALGMPGASNWRRGWADLLVGREVLVAFDNDEAGDAAAVRVVRDLRAAGALRVLRSKPLATKDWNDALVGRQT